MNLLLLESTDFINDKTVVIKDERFKHIDEIIKLEKGATLQAGMLNGLMGKATLTGKTETTATFTVALTEQAPEKLPLTVILALPRPKMLRRIFRNVAELGIKELYLINSYKVEKSYWQTPFLHEENIHKFLKEGLEQAKDTQLPKVHLKKLFKPFVEDDLPEVISGKQALLAHPYNAKPMPSPSKEERVVIIGPEGGFTDYEVKLIKEQGIESYTMGERIYKVENALTLLSAILSIN